MQRKNRIKLMRETIMNLPGLIVPPLTPFLDDRSVDYSTLEREVDYIVEECNAAMVSAAGVEATEYQYLTYESRCELIRRTIEFVNNRVPVIVGVSHSNVDIAIKLSCKAQKLGAAGVQILAPLRPFGGTPTLEDLMAYYDAIAIEIDLPIMLYLNPGPGCEVSPLWTIELAKMNQIKWVKESSRDLSRCARLIEEIDNSGYAHYFTTVQMLLASISIGGSGATMPPPIAYIANALIIAFKDKRYEEACRLQKQFSLFPACWMNFGLTPALKAAMEIIGFPIGKPYPPFKAVEGSQLIELKDLLKKTYLFEEEHKARIKKYMV